MSSFDEQYAAFQMDGYDPELDRENALQHEWGHLLAVEKAAYQAHAALERLAETLDAGPEIRQRIDQILLDWQPKPEPDWRLTPDSDDSDSDG